MFYLAQRRCRTVHRRAFAGFRQIAGGAATAALAARRHCGTCARQAVKIGEYF